MRDYDAESMGFRSHEEFEEWRNRDKRESAHPPTRQESAQAVEASMTPQSSVRRAEIRQELRELKLLMFDDQAQLSEIVYHRINELLDELEKLE